MISINIYEIIMQIGNFLILLFLLKKFLFGPLLSFLDKREQGIQSSIDQAAANKQKTSELLDEQEALLKKTREEARDLRQTAQDAAKKEREQLMAQAKEDAAKLAESAKQELANDVERVKKELVQFAGDLSINITKNVVKADLSADKHNDVVKTYLEKVKA